MSANQRLEEMIEFIREDLRNKSFSFDLTSDKNRFKFVKQNKQRGLILLTHQMPLKEFIALHNLNKREFGYSLSIFYKDGETFFKRMVDSSSYRADKSLKNYTLNDINHIISLTVQERYSMMGFSPSLVDNFSQMDLTDKVLYYYQPKTQRLIESVRKFRPEAVELDYSHIKPKDKGYGFSKNGLSKTYFFLKDLPIG